MPGALADAAEIQLHAAQPLSLPPPVRPLCLSLALSHSHRRELSQRPQELAQGRLHYDLAHQQRRPHPRHELDRNSAAYQAVYRQRSATERINSLAVELGIERPKLRNRQSITNLNTLLYILLNLHALQRVEEKSAPKGAWAPHPPKRLACPLWVWCKTQSRQRWGVCCVKASRPPDEPTSPLSPPPCRRDQTPALLTCCASFSAQRPKTRPRLLHAYPLRQPAVRPPLTNPCSLGAPAAAIQPPRLHFT